MNAKFLNQFHGSDASSGPPIDDILGSQDPPPASSVAVS